MPGDHRPAGPSTGSPRPPGPAPSRRGARRGDRRADASLPRLDRPRGGMREPGHLEDHDVTRGRVHESPANRPATDPGRRGQMGDVVHEGPPLVAHRADLLGEGSAPIGSVHAHRVHGDEADHEGGHDRRREDPERRVMPATRPPMGMGRGGDRRARRGRPCGADRTTSRSLLRSGRPPLRLAGREVHAASSTRSAARNLALRARGLRTRSSADGCSGFLVRTRRRSSSRNARLTIPSSRE